MSSLLSRQQWLITILCILIVAGYNYCIDWPQTLQAQLRLPPYRFSTLQFNMLYAVTHLPISLLSIPLGMLIDRLSLKGSLLLILMTALLSQLLMTVCFAMGFRQIYSALLILRGLFGMAGQGGTIIQAVVIRKVAGKDFDIMIGFCLTVPFLFNSLNSILTAVLYDHTDSMTIPLVVGTGVAAISLLSGFMLLNRLQKWKEMEQQQHHHHTSHSFNITSFKDFDRTFWLMILLTFLMACGLPTFLDNCNDLLIKRFGMLHSVAGGLLMIPNGLLPFLSIFWSNVLIKRYPHKRRLLFLLITILSVLCHLIILLMHNTDHSEVGQYVLVVIGFILYGLAVSGFETLIVPGITLIVPVNVLGMAFGASGSANALSQALMPLVDALIIGQGNDLQLAKTYHQLSYLYLGVVLLSLLVALVILLMKNESALKIDEGDEQEFEQIDSH